MIDVYFWPTGNGKKIPIMLADCGLPYNVIPLSINKGEPSTPWPGVVRQDLKPGSP
jgi:GSH-dependent disulfide-bond oxidoreductase